MNSRLLKKLWFLNKNTPNNKIGSKLRSFLAFFVSFFYRRGQSDALFNKSVQFWAFSKEHRSETVCRNIITSKVSLKERSFDTIKSFPRQIFPILSQGNTLLLFCLLSFFSCQEETTITIPTEMEVTEGFQKGVFITNEGNFNSGNASVTFYDLETQAVQEKIFETANNQQLGDVLQSMTVIEDKAYLVLNNSQKVEVVNLNDFSSVGTIGDLITPRYLTPIDATTAYVSDIFGAAISVVDLTSQQEMAKIPFGSASEEMVKIGNEMFVAQPSLSINTKKSSNQIFVINTNTNQVTDSIQVGYNPSEIEVDQRSRSSPSIYR